MLTQTISDKQLDALPSPTRERPADRNVRPADTTTPLAYRTELYAEWTLNETAAYALGNLGPAGVPLMIDTLKSGNADEQYQAATVLARIGTDATPAAVPLANLIHSSRDDKVRKQAAWALSQIGPALWPQQPEPPPEPYQQLLSQGEGDSNIDPTMPPTQPPALEIHPLPMPYVESAAAESSADAEMLSIQKRREKLEQERQLRRRQRAQRLQKEYEANLAEYRRRLQVAEYVAKTLAGVLQQTP